MTVARRLALALLLLAAWPAAPAAAQAPPDPPPGSAAWHERERANFQASRQRTADRAAQPWTFDLTRDPRRDLHRWAPARGEVLTTRIRNRYGVGLSVTMLRPRGDGAAPLPTVLVLPGQNAPAKSLHWLVEDLAEHGYLAVVVEPQGNGASESRPRAEFCAPGAWQEPQELGVREHGRCAGTDPRLDLEGWTASTVNFLDILLGRRTDTGAVARQYERTAARPVFAAFDAAAWLLSGANPWRAWVDPSRLGIAGHSLGGYAAAAVGNGDPRSRFRAAVALDAYHALDDHLPPRVPTLWLQGEQALVKRRRPPADPEGLHPARASVRRAAALGVPAALLVLRAATHETFTDGALPAPRNGQRVAAQQTLVWLDRFLKGDASATAGLFAERLDDRADRSSIGTGTRGRWGGNSPIRVAGLRRADELSLYYPSELAAFGADCRDLRRVPCPAPG